MRSASKKKGLERKIEVVGRRENETVQEREGETKEASNKLNGDKLFSHRGKVSRAQGERDQRSRAGPAASDAATEDPESAAAGLNCCSAASCRVAYSRVV